MNTLTPPANYVAQKDTRFRDVGDKTIWCVMATHCDRILAACSVVNGPKFSRITSMFVAPDSRNRGIGTGLIRFACDHVALKSNDVYLEVDSFDHTEAPSEGYQPPMDDRNLRDFYLRNGFTTVMGHPFSLVLRRPKGDT